MYEIYILQVILLPAGQSPMATYYVPQGIWLLIIILSLFLPPLHSFSPGMGGAHQVAYIQQPPAYSGPPPVLAQQQVPVQVRHWLQLFQKL